MDPHIVSIIDVSIKEVRVSDYMYGLNGDLYRYFYSPPLCGGLYDDRSEFILYEDVEERVKEIIGDHTGRVCSECYDKYVEEKELNKKVLEAETDEEYQSS